MAEIKVVRLSQTLFRVEIKEGSSKTFHDVTASGSDINRYGRGVPAEHLIEASFQFLLEREPKESILSSFELRLIEQYFPEYPKNIFQQIARKVSDK